jgi:hypothetical protein
MATHRMPLSARSAAPARRAALVLVVAVGIVLSPFHARASDAGSSLGTAGPSALPTRAE